MSRVLHTHSPPTVCLQGTGYLTCGNCVGVGSVAVSADRATASNGGEERCSICSGTGKVMCTACLCTGKAMATEHDPRMVSWLTGCVVC